MNSIFKSFLFLKFCDRLLIMLKQIKNPKTYLYGIPLAAIGVGIPFAVYGICCACGYNQFPYYTILLVFAALYGLLSYVSGDIIIYKYKKQKKEILPSEVPLEVREKANDYRAPFALALIVTLLVVAVFFIIYLATKHWPML